MARPEPMNVTTDHAKVKVSIDFSDPKFVAGQDITGKFELECRAEQGLAIGVVKAELLAIQELASRDHSATNTFIHQTRLYQGPQLPPSNAVYACAQPGIGPLPSDYYPARKGITTFFFRFPTPATSPATINFAKGLARLKYEVRVSIGVLWKEDRQLVSERKEIEVLESPGETTRGMEQVVIGENGKLWAQARVLNVYMVSGQPACVELFVKNHSLKKTSSLSVSLTRHLRLDAAARPDRILQISDTLLSVPFRGPEYIVLPGTEGIANLVFTIPKAARGIRSGPMYVEDGDESCEMDSLFHVQCLISIKIGMGLGSKDIVVELPVTILHPTALQLYGIQDPDLSAAPPNPLPNTTGHLMSPLPYSYQPYSPPPPLSPVLQSPPPDHHTNLLSPPYSPPLQNYYYWPPPLTPPPQDYAHQYYYPPIAPATVPPPRPLSADPHVSQPLPVIPSSTYVSPINLATPQSNASYGDSEPGKGDRASRISARLHRLSRNRSVSPLSHRFPQQPSNQLLEPNSIPAPSEGGSPHSVRTLHREMLSPADVSNTQSPAGVILAPRPMLSPKHSFVNLRDGTGKSLRVEELEKMAEKGLTALETEDKETTGATAAEGSPPENVESSQKFPSPPKRLRVTYRNGESGLNALEKRLMAQVGTRKPSVDRRADVRAVLQPIDVSAANEENAVAPNDSAISSLALSGGRGNSDRPSYVTVKPRHLSRNNISADPPEPIAKERAKRSEMQHLRKAATGRVADWLNTMQAHGLSSSSESSVSEAETEVKPTATETEELVHQMASSAQVVSSDSACEAHGDAVPTRSSGFLLRKSTIRDEPFTAVRDAGVRGAAASRDAVSNPAISQKPVLKRYQISQDPSGSKVPAQSTRGGRGGKVSSVAAMWESRSESKQQEQRKVSGGSSSSEPFRAKKEVVGIEATNIPKRVPNSNSFTANLADDKVLSRRPAIMKSSSVPAVLSSSLARPLLSSTASLARPTTQAAKKIYPPSASNETLTPSSTETLADNMSSRTPVKGEIAFGQARLRDLIRKYQQGF